MEVTSPNVQVSFYLFIFVWRKDAFVDEEERKYKRPKRIKM